MRATFKHIRQKVFQGIGETPHLLIIAGVHGDEYEPVLAVKRLASMMNGRIVRGRLTLVPVVNMPAFRNSSRCGEDGLDLARTCPGSVDGTVTERIAAEISKLISKSDYLIDLHGGGNALTIAPLTGYMLVTHKGVLEKQRQMALDFGLPVVWGTSPTLQGRTLSVARDADVPAIYVEYGGGGGVHPTVVERYIDGCLNVMKRMGMVEGIPQNHEVMYTVEDYRENSGHLQAMSPAPVSGIVELSVQLNDHISKGQRMAVIEDEFGKQLAEVKAEHDGVVFMLRAIPFVKKGDTLGGILPTTQSKTTIR